MAKRTERGTFLRDAIAHLLDGAETPMTTVQMASTQLMKDLGFTAQELSMMLHKMHTAVRNQYPLKRVRLADGHSRWGWYNYVLHPQLEDIIRPLVYDPIIVDRSACTPEKTCGFCGTTGHTESDHYAKPSEAPAPIDGSAASFEFKGIPELSAQPSEATVQVPATVRVLTLEVAGLRLRIELDTVPVAR